MSRLIRGERGRFGRRPQGSFRIAITLRPGPLPREVPLRLNLHCGSRR